MSQDKYREENTKSECSGGCSNDSLWNRLISLFNRVFFDKSQLRCPDCEAELVKVNLTVEHKELTVYYCPNCYPEFQASLSQSTNDFPVDINNSPNTKPSLHAIVFAIMKPENNVYDWYNNIYSKGQRGFTDEFKEILLDNSTWVGYVKTKEEFNSLKDYLRETVDKEGDVYVFMTSNLSSDICNSDICNIVTRDTFFRSDLEDICDILINKFAKIEAFTPLSHNNSLFSENPPYGINFRKP